MEEKLWEDPVVVYTDLPPFFLKTKDFDTVATQINYGLMSYMCMVQHDRLTPKIFHTNVPHICMALHNQF